MPYDGRLLAGVSVLMAVVEAGGMARAAEARRPHAFGSRPRDCAARERGSAFACSTAPRARCGLPMRAVDFTSRSARTSMASRRRRSRLRDRAARSRRLRVNMDAFLSRMALADAIGGFLDAHPDLRIELVMRDCRRPCRGRLRPGAALRRTAERAASSRQSSSRPAF